MAKRGAYRFSGCPADVVVTLSHPAKEVEPEFHPVAGGPANHDEQNVNKNATTEFHLWSTVLKEKSKYFEADILRWSNTTVSASPQPQSTPLRRTLKCIDDVGPAAYAQAFRAMYAAHYGESAHVIAKAVVKSLEDALELLRVASNLGFSEGVDAALLYIQSVLWTADEKASVARCISLLQVQVSEELALRLETNGQSVRLSREAVRDGLVRSWKQSLLEWRNAPETYSTNSEYKRGCDYVQRERSARSALSRTVGDVCNSMFLLFAHAASLGVGQTLVAFLVEKGNFLQLLSLIVSRGSITVTVISYEAVLLVLLRIMRALSEGEVLCTEELKEKMVYLCVTAFTCSSLALQQHFLPEADSTSLHLSQPQGEHKKHVVDLETYVSAYASRKSHIKRDLVNSMGQVLSTLKNSRRHIPITQLLGAIPNEKISYEYFDEIVTVLMSTLETVPVCIPCLPA